MLDPVHPSHLQCSFDRVVATLRERSGMKAFERLGGRALIALDGTEYFRSQKLGCPNCPTRKRSNGKIERYHSIGSRDAIRSASLCWRRPSRPDAWRPRHVRPRTRSGDHRQTRRRRKAGLRAQRRQVLQDIALARRAWRAHEGAAKPRWRAAAIFEFTAEPDSHKTPYDFMNGVALDELSLVAKEGARKPAYRYRWFTGAPLRDGKSLPPRRRGTPSPSIGSASPSATPRARSLTTAPLSPRSTSRARTSRKSRPAPGRGGRLVPAPAGIENESFNVLNNHGYHLEHNYSHGEQNLAMLFAALNLLALAIHTVCDCVEELWIKARQAKRARKRLFEHIRTITAYLVFPDWETLMTTLITSKPPQKSKNKSAPEIGEGPSRALKSPTFSVTMTRSLSDAGLLDRMVELAASSNVQEVNRVVAETREFDGEIR